MHAVMSARGGKGENIEARGGPCFSRQFAQQDINQKRGRGSMRSANFPRQNIVYMHTAFRAVPNNPPRRAGSLFLFPNSKCSLACQNVRRMGKRYILKYLRYTK